MRFRSSYIYPYPDRFDSTAVFVQIRRRFGQVAEQRFRVDATLFFIEALRQTSDLVKARSVIFSDDSQKHSALKPVSDLWRLLEDQVELLDAAQPAALDVDLALFRVDSRVARHPSESRTALAY